MTNQVRLGYWNLDEPTVKKNINSPSVCYPFFLVFLLSVTSPAHTLPTTPEIDRQIPQRTSQKRTREI